MDMNALRQEVDDEMVLPEDDEIALEARMAELQDHVEAEPPPRPTYLEVIATNTKRLQARPPRPVPRPPLHRCHSVICQRRVLLSIRLHKLGDLRAALCADQDAVTVDPGCELGWLQRGLTQYALKHYAEARASFERVIQLAEGVPYSVGGGGGGVVSSVEPAVAERARKMVQRLAELEAEQQVEAAASKQSRKDAKVLRMKKMAAPTIHWSGTDKQTGRTFALGPGDPYGFIRRPRPGSIAATLPAAAS